MSIPIIEQIRDYLQRHGPASAQSVAQAIPELEECGGVELARCGEQNQKERWNPQTEEEAFLPAFLFGDICFGIGRFLVGALREVKLRILDDEYTSVTPMPTSSEMNP
jgi:hypothetical protein